MPKVRLTEYSEGHLSGCECDGCYGASYRWRLVWTQAENEPEVRDLDQRYQSERDALVRSLMPRFIEE